jgi:arylsulfatase A-like enzyme
MRTLLLFAGLWTAAPAMAAGGDSEADHRPNIVFILADDLGWTDLSCQGSEYYETPQIDSLAADGMRLLRYYNCQNCAPTRAALMSGQHGVRTGIYTVGSGERGRAEDRRLRPPPNRTRLPLETVTLAQALGQAGYATGMFGKWHLGTDGDYHPGRRGFDEAIQSNGRHFQFVTDPPVVYPEGQYLADFLTDCAVDFIARHEHHPFFLYVSHFAVHTPIEARADYEAAWSARPPRGTHWHGTYAAMIQSVDESVGRILAALESHQLARRTVVIFSSDNGGLGGYQRTEPPSSQRGFTDNAPLRGGKGTLYEGGIRVPFIVRWPGVVPGGSTSPTPVAHVDVYPTFVDIAQGGLPDGQILDGTSFLPTLKDPHAPPDRGPIFWHFPGYLESYVHARGWRTTPVGAIHDGDYKLMEFFEDGRLELYNLREDPGEREDLASCQPQRAAALHRQLIDWRERMAAPMPQAIAD